MRGFRTRNGVADGSSRCTRRRVKNRNSRRYSRRMELSDSESRSAEGFCSLAPPGCSFLFPPINLADTASHAFIPAPVATKTRSACRMARAL